MGMAALGNIRTNLMGKRDLLAEWLRTSAASERKGRLGPAAEQNVYEHLQVIDQTVQAAAEGELGICTVCHTAIEPELMEMDYTAQVCLGDMTAEQARRLEFELELTQNVQRALLPQSPPQTPVLDVAAFSRPAEIVGGDYFDFLQFSNGTHGLAIADVAGHGLSAGMQMAAIQGALRSLCPLSASPAEVTSRIHHLFIHNIHFNTFVTLFLGSFDPDSHTLTFVNAGHNPPLLLRGAGGFWPATEWLLPTSPAIGLVEEGSFEEGAITLTPGDAMLLYTDGVTEAENSSGEPFGVERLSAAVHNAPPSAGEMLRSVRQSLQDYSGNRPLEDDVTIVVIRVIA